MELRLPLILSALKKGMTIQLPVMCLGGWFLSGIGGGARQLALTPLGIRLGQRFTAGFAL